MSRIFWTHILHTFGHSDKEKYHQKIQLKNTMIFLFVKGFLKIKSKYIYDN